ncbi:MAG TPA: MBL fold metallo-hydrolase [Iamia sp.]|nr:MBL fold metallo-hydrolase [Iamia sp.]
MSAITGARIRSYNVGFGDAFLLTFTYDDGKARNVLIDFGSTARPARPGSMEAVAEKIAEHCGGSLDVVVATHRHADHISGFGGKAGAIIKTLKPELVIQPWTEDPRLDPKATAPSSGGLALSRGLTASLSSMQAFAAAAAREAPALAGCKGVSAAQVERIRFLGETNLSNAAAVKNLATMGKNVYAHHGSKLPIKTLLPGVKIDVLGPPTLEQAPDIGRMASKNAQEYWHLAAARATRDDTGGAGPLFPARAATTALPQEARWVVPQVDKAHTQEMLGILRSLDDALNNTSLILLIEVAGTTLLFPGDAQWENWRYALVDAPDAEATCARLAQTSVYKVGHHGSLNATPKTLWNLFAHRSTDPEAAGRLISMMSTKADKHGSTRAGTEVPRRKLEDELEARSTLVSTKGMTAAKTFWKDVDVPL